MPNNTSNNPVHNQTQAGIGLKNGNQFLEMISGIVSKQIGLKNIPIHLYGQVINVSNTGDTADIQLSYGSSDPIFHNLSNKSGVILNIGDTVMITAPTGDLTDCFIDKNNNPIPTIAGENIIGVLTIGGITQNGQDNTNGELIIKGVSNSGTGNNIGIIMHDHTIDLYDWQNSGTKVGTVQASRDIGDGSYNGVAGLYVVAEQNCATGFGYRNSDNVTFGGALVVNNNAYNNTQDVTVHLPLNVNNYFGTTVDAHHGIYCQTDASGGNQIFGDMNCEGYNWSNCNSFSCTNLSVSGSKNCVQEVSAGQVLFYSIESTESFLCDKVRYTTEIGTNIVYFDTMFAESVNLDIFYDIIFIPDDTSCVFKIIDRKSDCFTFDASIVTNCTIKIEAKRRGFEDCRLEYANNLKQQLDNESFLHNQLLNSMMNTIEKEYENIINDLWSYGNINNIINDLFYIAEKKIN